MDTPLSKSASVNIRPENVHNNGGFQPDIYIPKSFPEDGEDPMWMFKPFELRYLDALHRGEDPEKAISDSGITPRHATWLLKRKKCRDYMGQLLRQRLASEAWTQEKWISEGTTVWEGKKKDVSREQMEAWKEIGARVCPKPERSNEGRDRVVININVSAATSALKRQEIIEGQLVEPVKSETSHRDLQGSLQKESALPV